MTTITTRLLLIVVLLVAVTHCSAPAPGQDPPCSAASGEGGVAGSPGAGGEGGSAGMGGAGGGDACVSFQAYEAQLQPCDNDADCPLTDNPCTFAWCSNDGLCVAGSPGEGQPGACPNGLWCTLIDQGSEEYSCCPGPPQCIVDPTTNCVAGDPCPQSNPICVENYCCQ